MPDPACRACGRTGLRMVRRVCARCTRHIVTGKAPDVRAPSSHGFGSAYDTIRSPEAVAKRMARTEGRYPHLQRKA